MDYIFEQKKTPVLRKVNVLVVGGGPAGFGAAVAAARNGAEALLVERYGFLGGMLTAGLILWLPIDKLIPLKSYGETKPLQGGIVAEFVSRLTSFGGAIDPATAYQAAVGFEGYLPTDPEVSKIVLQGMMEESRADMLLHSLAVDVVKDGNQVKGIIVESKSGRHAILADVVIDASGDADIAAAAGAEYEKFDRPLTMTLVAALANVDAAKAIKYSSVEGKNEFESLVDDAVRKGDLTVTEKKILPEVPPVRVKYPVVNDPDKVPANWHRRGEACGWMGHYLGDCTNVLDLTKAELTTRRTLLSIVNFFKKYVPGYEKAYLSQTATQIGLRESRRVLGNYLLTADKDLKKGLKHADVIVRCRQSSARDMTLYDTPTRAPVWDIPYRCIVPKIIDSLLVAGRCISIDHTAASLLSPRDECTCICLGQAAGTAAALSVKAKVTPRDLDIGILQETLRNQGANV